MPALLAPAVILPVYVVTPFVLMLLSIAIFPLALPHWWEANRNKLLISALLGLPVLLLYLGRRPHALLETAEEYVSFILLLASLYVISGGIRLTGDLEATPLTTTAFLAAGLTVASLPSTTVAFVM